MPEHEKRRISKEDRPKISADLGLRFFRLTQSTQSEELDAVLEKPERTVFNQIEQPSQFVSITILPQVAPADLEEEAISSKVRKLSPINPALLAQLPEEFSYPLVYVEMYTDPDYLVENNGDSEDTELVTTPFKKMPIPNEAVSLEGKKYRFYNSYLLNTLGLGLKITESTPLPETEATKDALYQLDTYPAYPLQVFSPLKPWDIRRLSNVINDIEAEKYEPVSLP